MASISALTSSSATAIAIGQNGSTNPAFVVDASTGTSATGVKVKSAAAAGGVALSAVSSGTNESLLIDAKGSGTIDLNTTGTGAINAKRALNVTGAVVGTSAGAAALAIGANGSTNPVLQIDASTGSVATGIKITGAAAAAACALAVISSGANENLTLDAKGSGTMTLNGTATGAISLARNTTVTGTFGVTGAGTITSTSASALTVGANGSTNPVLQVDANTANVATGLKVTGAAAAAGLALAVVSSGTNENLAIDAKGSGTITLGGTLTGNIVATRAIAGALGITSAGPTAGIGYATGAGGAVTQATNRSTGVTLNTVSGAITLVSAAGSATASSFTVTNSAVAATDTVIICQKSGTDKYITMVTAVAAGSFQVTSFTTGGTTTEQPVFNFAVIKAVAA